MNLLSGTLIGLAVGWWLWGGQPDYIGAVARSEGQSFILAKMTFGTPDQVAVIHGLVDDRTGCETFRRAMQAEGGEWACIPAY